MAATDLDITSSCSGVQRKEAVLPAFLLFFEEKGVFQNLQQTFPQVPKVGLTATLSCKESWERENIWLFQS